MLPYYKQLSEQLKFSPEDPFLKSAEKSNKEELEQLDAKIKDAEENLGETDLSDALIKRALFFARIGDKNEAVEAYRVAYEKTAPLGYRIDIVFSVIRIGFFFNDDDLVVRNIEKVKSLVEEGGDWDRRNRLKVYEGIYKSSIRNFTEATDLLLDTLATYTSTELMDYSTFVKYSVLAASITLERPDFKKKVVDSPEILEVIHELPHIESFINSFYDCNYTQFFQSLAAIEKDLKNDIYLHDHYKYYVREMKGRVYIQLLESYRSLTLESMAKSFGVTTEWIDNDLSKYIASGKINAVIDKVKGIVETNRSDTKNSQYQATIKHGDLLLNRIQKLSRVISV